MQTYTHYTKETERPTTKLSVANVNRVFTAPTVLVKINPLFTTTNNDGECCCLAYSGLMITSVTKILRDTNRVFDLLEKNGVRLGALADEFIGDAEYVLFTRNQDGSYNMSLKDFDFGLPEDIIELRRATKLAREVNGLYKSYRLPPGQRLLTESQKSAYLKVVSANVRLHRAFHAAMGMGRDVPQAVIDTRIRLLTAAVDVMAIFEHHA